MLTFLAAILAFAAGWFANDMRKGLQRLYRGIAEAMRDFRL